MLEASLGYIGDSERSWQSILPWNGSFERLQSEVTCCEVYQYVLKYSPKKRKLHPLTLWDDRSDALSIELPQNLTAGLHLCFQLLSSDMMAKVKVQRSVCFTG